MDEPLVSVVTPVYNGERYLAECIESVLSQTYPNWEYVIVNDRSTDRSLEIALGYAARDGRIRVHTNEEFLPIYRNFNAMLRHISSQSRYCKILHADDLLFPDCLARMVELAEAFPNAGIVGAYALQDRKVMWDGMLTHRETVVPGRDVCRRSLLAGPYVFGTPTTTLIRSDLIRKRPVFYNEENPNPDMEVCFDLLRESDFGFVHRVLTYTRMHEASQTSRDALCGAYIFGKFATLWKFGPVYLTEREFSRRMDDWLLHFWLVFLKYLAAGRAAAYWRYNYRAAVRLGYRFGVTKSLKVLLRAVMEVRCTVRDGGLLIRPARKIL